MHDFNKMYELAKSYYEYYGNLLIPQDFKTTDGITYEENGKKLGQWIHNQRQAYKGNGEHKIDEEQIELLEKIGMVWDVNYNLWQENYELAKAYYEHYGNLLVPYNFKTLDGITYDENGKKLGYWINNQRHAYKGDSNSRIDEDQKKLLEKIGMVWDVNYYLWQENYELAKTYYLHYGNLLVPINFKTTDGIIYDENGKKLGYWIKNQRQAYKGNGTNKIDEEQIELLEKIGMIWSVRSNQNEITSLCDKYNIDTKINKEVLNHQSIQELVSKIEYLLDNNIPLCNDEGKLHEIFSLSGASMKEKYNITLEELINKYYENNKKKGSI